MAILEQMMDQAKAAIDEMTNLMVRIDSIKGQSEDLRDHVGDIGAASLVAAQQKVIDACDAALASLSGARGDVTKVAHMVQNAGGRGL